MRLLAVLLLLAASGADRVVAQGTAVKDDPCLKRRMTTCKPFEYLTWTVEPTGRQINRAFPDSASEWLYAGFFCTDLTRAGGLKGCKAQNYLSAEAAKRHARALPLLRAYRIGPAQSDRLRGRLNQVQITLQIQFAGVSDMGDCGNAGFCFVTPPPPPPPPARQPSPLVARPSPR